MEFVPKCSKSRGSVKVIPQFLSMSILDYGDSLTQNGLTESLSNLCTQYLLPKSVPELLEPGDIDPYHESGYEPLQRCVCR